MELRTYFQRPRSWVRREDSVPLFKGVPASCHKAKAIKKNIFSAVVEYTYWTITPFPSFLTCPFLGRRTLVDQRAHGS